ncbi:MAG: transglutaminase domain-containing protein [Eubacterium sp.]
MKQRLQNAENHRISLKILILLIAFCLTASMIPVISGSTSSYAASKKTSKKTSSAASIKKKTGDLSRITRKQAQPQKATASAALRAYRSAMRSSSKGSVLTSGQWTKGSSSDYYYQHLTTRQKKLYNAMLTLAQDPYSENIVVYTSTKNASDDGTTGTDWFLAYQSLIYDHAELFWLWMDGGDSAFVYDPVQIGNSYKWVMWMDLSASGQNTTSRQEMPVRLFNTESGYKQVKAQFNTAVNNFLSDIDRNHSDAVVAMEIHDKLCKQITYNDAANDTNAFFYDPSHTAYGALVGGKAVCDGYALAYSYLLKKCGISSAVALGYVGSSAQTGGHAWNLVKLSGSWYEADATWDDDDTNNSYNHAFLFITTKQISSQMPGIKANTVHHRDSTEPYKSLSRLLPTATATHFNPSYMSKSGQTLSDNTDSEGKAVSLGAVYSSKIYPLTAAPSASNGKWTLKIVTSNLKDDSSVYKAEGVSASDSSLLAVPTWSTASRALTLKLKDSSSSTSSDSSSNDISAVKVKVEYDNGTTGTITANLTVKANVLAAQRPYNGKARSASFAVTTLNGATVPASAYSAVLYSGAVEPGIYANLVSFRDGTLYSGNGTKLVWMTIVPRTASITGASQSGRRLTVKWTSENNSASGYQIEVSSNKSFSSSSTKTYSVSGSSAKKLVKTLSRSGKYKYVRIRAYANGSWHGISSSSASMKKDGSAATLYSKWSSAKSISGFSSSSKAA